jgi:hypoxanthine phosphoribosyltransferase
VIEKPAVLFTEDEIRRRVSEVSAEIGAACEGRIVSVVGLMKGCLCFMADMVRALPVEVTCHFLRVVAQRGEGHPPRTEIAFESTIAWTDRDVLLLDDVVDTGITLHYILNHIKEHAPRSLQVCALVDKPAERKVEVRPDWALFTLPERTEGQFIVGYGLDLAERYRGLPYLGVVARTAGPA